jgi:hypothetical protein
VNLAKSTVAARAPSDDDATRSLRATLDARFDALFTGIDPGFGTERLYEVTGSEGATPFDVETAAAAGRALARAESEVARFREIGAQWNEFLRALAAYDRLLTEVDTAFVALTTLSSDPFTPGGSVQQFVDSALAIRGHAQDIQRLLTM